MPYLCYHAGGLLMLLYLANSALISTHSKAFASFHHALFRRKAFEQPSRQHRKEQDSPGKQASDRVSPLLRIPEAWCQLMQLGEGNALAGASPATDRSDTEPDEWIQDWQGWTDSCAQSPSGERIG